jgi:hypothetical protein
MASLIKKLGMWFLLANLQPLPAQAERQNIFDLIGESHAELRTLLEGSGGECKNIPAKDIEVSGMKNGLTRVPPISNTKKYPWPTLQCKIFGWELFAAYDEISDSVILIDIEYEDDTAAIERIYDDHTKAIEAPDLLLLKGQDYKIYVPSDRDDFTKFLSLGCGRTHNSWDFNSYYLPRNLLFTPKNYHCLSETSIQNDTYITRRFFITDGFFRKRVIHKGSISVRSKQVVKDLAAMSVKVLRQTSQAAEREQIELKERAKKSETLRRLLSVD